MAQQRSIRIEMPELNRVDDGSVLGQTAACILTLKTDKGFRGGIRSGAQVGWVKGYFESHLLYGDFSKTIKTIQGVATQKRIDTQHAEIFTPAFIEQIKQEVRAFYQGADKAAESIRDTFDRQVEVA